MSPRLNRTARRSGGRRTAVVKANYVKTREAGAHRRITASADYYGQDKDIDGSYKGELEAFDHERDDLGKQDVNAFHEDNFGEHKYCYRATLSPGTDLGPDEMRQFVRDSMSDLEVIRGHEINYQAYVHDDHEHPHAHVMFYEDTTMRKWELNGWRQQATTHAHELEQANVHDTSLKSELSDELNQKLSMLAHDFANEVGNQALRQVVGSPDVKEEDVKKEDEDDMIWELERLNREPDEADATGEPGHDTPRLAHHDDLDF